MKLSVIVPCYNEVESVKTFYESITTTFKKEKLDYELIMINDGSTDDTLLKLKEYKEDSKNIKIISFSRNFGKEAAMLAGLKEATGDYYAIIDVDMQQNPETLVLMYQKLLDNKDYDSVAAYRSSHEDQSGFKRFLTSIFYKIINRVSDIKLLPGASDFRVFNKNVRDAIISLPEKTRFLKGIFSWIGYNTIYIPYTPNKRVHGKSKWSLVKLTRYAIGGIVSFSTFFLRLSFIIGILVFIIGFLNFILLGNLSSRTIILFISLMMLQIGNIALYISRMYNNVLGRPLYIIKEKIGFDTKAAK